ncbi:PLP-dependent transferase [Athelia psychrophila]|uniref:PLP-dependent transferase n=1 Tax=Athelia psychrophila TaxID=1759441 RepID=A0A167WBK1_9AGAM|nr:PLP-dependent transferase [Fibularhizoctonia sp. CBS 109695]
MPGAPGLAFRLSRQATSTISPPIPQAYKWATSYVPTLQRPLLDMSQGVPGIPPPEALLDAIGNASKSPSACGYCPVPGELSLRQALADEMKHVYGREGAVDINPDDVMITSGCNMAFTATVMSLADAGDEVILPVPWYFNHQMTLNLLGITTVPLMTTAESGFKPSPELAATLITPKTKAIALVTPNNPTGAVYPPSLIASFAILARKHNIALILDETYRDFLLTGPPHSLFSSQEQSWRSTLIHLFSFSKSYCIPGHRLGAIVAAPAILTATRTVLDCLQICAPRPPQLALAPLLPQLRPFTRAHAESIDARHALFRSVLPPRWTIGAQGGFFAFVRHPFKGVSASVVSERLAREVGVVTLPAEFFCQAKADIVVKDGEQETVVREVVSPADDDMWIRFSVANVDDEKVRKICERLAECESTFGWELA